MLLTELLHIVNANVFGSLHLLSVATLVVINLFDVVLAYLRVDLLHFLLFLEHSYYLAVAKSLTKGQLLIEHLIYLAFELNKVSPIFSHLLTYELQDVIVVPIT